MRPPVDLSPVSADKRAELELRFYRQDQLQNLATSLFVLTCTIIMVHPGLSKWVQQKVAHSPLALTPVVAMRGELKSPPATPETGNATFPLPGLHPDQVKITGRVGDSRDNGRRKHAGVDYAYTGPIVSALDGVVTELKPNSRVGGIIAITSQWQGKTVVIRYVHLNRQELRTRQLGESVKAGELIGRIEMTFPGSTGPHPHIEVYVNGTLNSEPHKFLKALHLGKSPTAFPSPEVKDWKLGLPIPSLDLAKNGGRFTAEHPGLDFVIPEGTPVVAVAEGVVTHAGWDEWGLGWSVKVEHPNGMTSVYGHGCCGVKWQPRKSSLQVKLGDRVSRSQLLMKSGHTGHSLSPHLHFELRRPPTVKPDGTEVTNWLNPEVFYPQFLKLPIFSPEN